MKESNVKILERWLHNAKEELEKAKADAKADAEAAAKADAAKAEAKADADKAKAKAKAEAKAKADAAEDKYENVKKEKGDEHADTLKAQLEWYKAQLEWFEAKKNVIRSNRALASLLGQEVESFDNDLVANDADQTAVRKQMSKHETQGTPFSRLTAPRHRFACSACVRCRLFVSFCLMFAHSLFLSVLSILLALSSPRLSLSSHSSIVTCSARLGWVWLFFFPFLF
ncbi:MAG: hypothetical protein VXZ18_16620 [Pseudomonadota bacterium]|nr:hypothetical protein [Pseudomonadota bacterium]